MNERIKNKLFLIIIITLIIIISVLLFFTRFGKIENKYLKPTGNIDVFDIDIDDIYNCDNNNKCENNKCENNNIYPVWNEEYYKNELNKIYVDDNNGDYIYQQYLNIFNNAFYEYTSKIAPGVSNTYYFVVHNSSSVDVNYYVEMYENTDYDINLKYRLKKNNEYVAGNDEEWVTADELKTAFNHLNKKGSDKYFLDWKWDYDSNNDEKDTYIGENMDDYYKLNIRFYFEQA